MLRSVKSSQRAPRVIALQIAWSAGVPSIVSGLGSTDATLTDEGTGDVTITFAKAFARAPIVVASPIAASGDAIVTLDAQPGVASCRLNVWDGTDGTTAKDNIPLNVIIVGYDSADQT